MSSGTVHARRLGKSIPECHPGVPSGSAVSASRRGRTLRWSVAGASVLSLVAGQPLLACSLSAWFDEPYRPTGTLFIGRALADTVAAGPGSIRYTLEEGHFGRPVERTIHGQLISVERLAAAVPLELRNQIRAAGDRVVLVPWDYDAGCGPVPWARSARWVGAGERGVFEARLRDREHWAGDIPTFDVRAPQMVPYPAAIPRATRTAYVGAALAPDELLELMDSLPTFEEFRRDPPRALARIEGWARAYPELAARFPARRTLDMARRVADREMALAREVALAGTYRFVMTAGNDSAVFFVRTRRTPTTVVHHRTREDLRRGVSGAVRPLVGVAVLACAAASREALPLHCVSGREVQQGYLSVTDSVARDAEGREQRGGALDFLRAFSRQAPVPGLAAIAQQAFELTNALPDDQYLYFPGTFTTYPDGRVTFEHVILRDGVAAIRIRGERVSSVVLER